MEIVPIISQKFGLLVMTSSALFHKLTLLTAAFDFFVDGWRSRSSPCGSNGLLLLNRLLKFFFISLYRVLGRNFYPLPSFEFHNRPCALLAIEDLIHITALLHALVPVQCLRTLLFAVTMTAYTGLDIEEQEDRKPVLGKKFSRSSLKFSSIKSGFSSQNGDIRYTSRRATWFFQDRYHDILPFLRKTNQSLRHASWRVTFGNVGVQLALWSIIIGFLVLSVYLPDMAYKTFTAGPYS